MGRIRPLDQVDGFTRRSGGRRVSRPGLIYAVCVVPLMVLTLLCLVKSHVPTLPPRTALPAVLAGGLSRLALTSWRGPINITVGIRHVPFLSNQWLLFCAMIIT